MGQGATFPFPLIDTWRVEYEAVDPGTTINYQSIGSGTTENTVDIGASDAPSAVVSSAANLPAGGASWNNITLINAQGADSYPIANFSYLLLNKEMADNPSMTQAKATALLDFINWAITDGQQFAPELEYARLSQLK